MRALLVFIATCICATVAYAQAKFISEAEYNKLMDYAVHATNADFPFVFTVTTEFVENGKTVRTVTERNERETQLRDRTVRTTTTSSGTSNQYQISLGFANNYCSKDGKSWTTSKYSCFGPVNFYGPEEPISVERTNNVEILKGKPYRMLREFTIFLPTETIGKRRFSEEVSTLDSRGFFISVVATEGILDPKLITLVRKQLWTKEKFESITLPESALSCSANKVLDFALPKWKADPKIRIEDAYKWTYQATRGGEHAVPDEEMARQWLDREWQTLGEPFKDEAEWEPLCPGGEVGRLNLRPFKKEGGKEDDLVAAFLASSCEYRPDPADFVQAWNELGTRLKKHPFGKLNLISWQKLDREMKAKNYPAIHHSSAYETARKPSYRVLTNTEMEHLDSPPSRQLLGGLTYCLTPITKENFF